MVKGSSQWGQTLYTTRALDNWQTSISIIGKRKQSFENRNFIQMFKIFIQTGSMCRKFIKHIAQGTSVSVNRESTGHGTTTFRPWVNTRLLERVVKSWENRYFVWILNENGQWLVKTAAQHRIYDTSRSYLRLIYSSEIKAEEIDSVSVIKWPIALFQWPSVVERAISFSR